MKFYETVENNQQTINSSKFKKFRTINKNSFMYKRKAIELE